MLIKNDIKNLADIESFLHLFYSRVVSDRSIAIIFTKIFPVNMSHHFPIITDFWETILLGSTVYKKNAMEVHFKINKNSRYKKNILMPGFIYSM